MRLDEFLNWETGNYSPELHLVRIHWMGPEPVYDVGTSLNYAFHLLLHDNPEHHRRAADIVRRVIGLQETEGAWRRGTWKWTQMKASGECKPEGHPIDARNVALSVAHALLPVWHAGRGRLDGEALEAIAQALELAAKHYLERQPASALYTNIAVGSGVAGILTGEITGATSFVEQGRRLLEEVRDLAERDGSFFEYNSPMYSGTCLEILDLGLAYGKDFGSRSVVEDLRRRFWRMVADHMHPGTGQIAGPHTRSKSEWLTESEGLRLFVRGGHPRSFRDERGVMRPLAEPASADWTYHARPCPPEIRERLERLPRPQTLLRDRFTRVGTTDVTATTWLTEDACLGSISLAALHGDCRAVQAFWRTDEDGAVSFRVRLLRDGADFPGGFRTLQVGPRLLAFLDHPDAASALSWQLSPPTCRGSEVRLRCQLRGRGVTLADLGGDRAALRAGGRQVVVHQAIGGDEKGVRCWEWSRGDDCVGVDAVLAIGWFGFFRLRPLGVALGLELVDVAGQVATAAPRWASGVLRWNPAPAVELSLRADGGPVGA